MKSALLAALMAAVVSPPLQAQTVAIVDVDIVHLDAGEMLSSRTVIIREGLIVAIEPAADVTLPTDAARIDGEGLFLVPGRAEILAGVPAGAYARMPDVKPARKPNRERLPLDPLDWQDDLLVRSASGVTTLGVDGVDGRELGVLRAMAPSAIPIPRLVMPTEVANAPRRVEVGAVADLVLLEDDPTTAATSDRLPLAVIVGGRVHTRAAFEALASAAARDRRSWQMAAMPSQHINGKDRNWDASCEGETFDACFGGNPDCGFWHILVPFDRERYDCFAATNPADRQATLRSLDRLATLAPSDGWITGQRVHLSIIEGRLDHALESAESCAAEAWWCAALRGLVLHRMRPGTAGPVFDSAYTSAFSGAPEGTPAWHPSPAPGAGDRGVRCEWSDVSDLIESLELRAEYDAGECGDRAGFEARYWWLADPLWSQPGNERKDEHYARNVMARVRDDFLRAVVYVQRFRNGEDNGKNHAHCTLLADVRALDWTGSSYPDGHRVHPNGPCPSSHRQLVRIGLPNSWRGVPYSVEPPGWRFNAVGYLTNPDPGSKFRRYQGALVSTTYARAQLREGYLHGGYSFTPSAVAFRTPDSTTAAEWALSWNKGYERMLTRETWYNLDHQVAVVRRGEELRVLAASAFPTILPSLDSLDGFLAVGRARDQHVEVAFALVDRGSGVMRADISLPDDDWVASVEALAPDVRGRARLGAPAPALTEGFGISRPVLTTPDFDPDRDDLLGAMLPSSRVPATGEVGLYAEVYGVEVGQSVRMALTYDPGERERSVLGRIVGVFGIGGGDPDPVRLEWTEQLESVRNGIGHVFVTTDLGDYADVELEVTMRATVGDRTDTDGVTLRPRR